MHIVEKLKSSIRKRATKLALSLNYYLGNYNNIIWLIGSARSGTTWVSDLINHDKMYREMFEPFHPSLVNIMSFLLPHQYIRPSSSNGELEKISSEIFNGKFLNPRIDSNNSPKMYNGILVKDIFANLFARWVSLRFPHVKIVLLIRNPFAVALSTYKKKDWQWVTDPMVLLNQKDLYEDYLHPFEGIIRRTSIENDYITCQVLIWCIVNYVPLKQFKPNQIHICFYEDIYTSPNREISNIYKYINPALTDHQIKLKDDLISRPSRVIGSDSNILNRTSPISSWKDELTSQQIDSGNEILKYFGFDDLYDKNGMPNREALKKFS